MAPTELKQPRAHRFRAKFLNISQSDKKLIELFGLFEIFANFLNGRANSRNHMFGPRSYFLAFSIPT